MNFHEVRFPAALSVGSSGGPERRTEIVDAEQRLRGAQLALGAFAAALRRRARGALARRSRGGDRVLRGAARAALRVPLEGLDRLQVVPALGDAVGASTRRSARATGRGRCSRWPRPTPPATQAYVRPIAKPVAGTVRVARGRGRRLAGPISRSIMARARCVSAPPPAAGAEVTAGFEFDVPVRFDTDRISASLAGSRRARSRRSRWSRCGSDARDRSGAAGAARRRGDASLPLLAGAAPGRRRARLHRPRRGRRRSTAWCFGRAAAWTRARCSRRPA